MHSTTGAIKRQIIGQFTANGTTEVTVNVPVLEKTSVILVSLNTVGGTPAGQPYVSTKDVSAKQIGFKAAAGDTSIYDVVLFA